MKMSHKKGKRGIVRLGFWGRIVPRVRFTPKAISIIQTERHYAEWISILAKAFLILSDGLDVYDNTVSSN
jgi:hypothetical protein